MCAYVRFGYCVCVCAGIPIPSAQFMPGRATNKSVSDMCVRKCVPNGVRRRRARICISGACRAVRCVHTCARRGRSPTANGPMPRVIGPHIDVIIYCLTDRTAARILMGVRGNYAVLAECGKPWTRAHAHVTSISRIRLGRGTDFGVEKCPGDLLKGRSYATCNMCNILIKSPAI